MKKVFVWIGILMVISIVLLLVLRVTKLCPKYINRMPGPPNYELPPPNLGEKLYDWGLCPGTEVLW